jgi:glycosyltransferase involved in cell wall biosynthesis
MSTFSSKSVALAHHWLVGMRGGEKVLEQLSAILPGAPIYTLVARPERLSAALRQHKIHTSWLQNVPGGSRHYKKLLPLFPSAVSNLKIKEPAELVVSSDASVIKGLQVPSSAIHVCYCHSPPRYLWDLTDDYMQSAETGGAVGRAVFEKVVPYVREFDRLAAKGVTHFIANSAFVRDRTMKYYGRAAHVIHPPVSLDDFHVSKKKPEKFYLIVSQLVPYKRIDLAVAACRRLGRRLIIIGDGGERARLEQIAGSHVSLLGPQPHRVLRDYYQRCQALIFPGIEDFGITPLEAMASGRPVIAYRAGGALETVKDGVTGIFFNEPRVSSLIDAIERFEDRMDEFDPAVCRAHAERFGPKRFRQEMSQFLQSVIASHAKAPPQASTLESKKHSKSAGRGSVSSAGHTRA